MTCVRHQDLSEDLADKSYVSWGPTRGRACVIVLTVGGFTIGVSLHRCSIAILRLWVALMVWVRLPVGLALIGRRVGVVWWCVVGLAGLWGDGGLPGRWFSGMGHV